MDWDAAIRRLAENGFTAILPNMLWGGVAFYPSAVLPVAPEVATRGDQIAQCLAACRKHGVQIHVWKVNWNLGSAPKEFVERMRREGRLQADAQRRGGTVALPVASRQPEARRSTRWSRSRAATPWTAFTSTTSAIRTATIVSAPAAGSGSQQLGGSRALRWPAGRADQAGPHRQAWLDWRRGQHHRRRPGRQRAGPGRPAQDPTLRRGLPQLARGPRQRGAGLEALVRARLPRFRLPDGLHDQRRAVRELGKEPEGVGRDHALLSGDRGAG